MRSSPSAARPPIQTLSPSKPRPFRRTQVYAKSAAAPPSSAAGAAPPHSAAAAVAGDVLRPYKEALLGVRARLAGLPHPHAWPVQRVYEGDRAVLLVRQYLHANLAQRISTRPFLTLIEKVRRRRRCGDDGDGDGANVRGRRGPMKCCDDQEEGS